MSEQTQALIAQLTTRLTAAAQDSDWTALTAVDREIAASLPLLQPLPTHLKPALAQLKTAHTKARRLLEENTARLGEQIAQLGEQGEGMRAYHELGGIE